MKQGVLKSDRDDKMVPGFPAFELEGKWEHDSIGALLGAGMDCWSEGKLTSNGRLIIQFREGEKIRTFAVEPGFFELKVA